jgi:hypothetical protein
MSPPAPDELDFFLFFFVFFSHFLFYSPRRLLLINSSFRFFFLPMMVALGYSIGRDDLVGSQAKRSRR